MSVTGRHDDVTQDNMQSHMDLSLTHTYITFPLSILYTHTHTLHSTLSEVDAKFAPCIVTLAGGVPTYKEIGEMVRNVGADCPKQDCGASDCTTKRRRRTATTWYTLGIFKITEFRKKYTPDNSRHTILKNQVHLEDRSHQKSLPLLHHHCYYHLSIRPVMTSSNESLHGSN